MTLRMLIIGATVAVSAATPLFAQETGVGIADARGYVSGLGGFARSITNTTGDVNLEGGVRIAPHVMVFGTVGRMANLQADLQPTLDNTITALSDKQGLGVVGSGRLPATFVNGGLRVEVPAGGRIMPYVLGAAGVARLNPTAQFTFASGTLSDGSTPNIGTDVTQSIVSDGSFASPAASSAFMFMAGGGVQLPVAHHWMVDAGYRFSRIAADKTLSASPLTTNGLSFGFGYRF